MANVVFGNHSSVIVPKQDRDGIRKFYCDVLGGEITKAQEERDFLRLGDNFFIVFLYGDVPDESAFSRTARSIWLELKSDNVEEMTRKILDSGARKLDMPDPHFYFQAPGGQCWRLVGTNEDLSFYEGAEEGPNVGRIKEALVKEQSFHTSIEVAVTPAEAFNHINNVSKWWIRNFKGESTSLNDEFSVTVPGQHYSKHKLIELVPDKKVVWLVTDSTLDWIKKDKNEWTNTKMVFEITPKGDKTVIKFTHEGLVPDQECYAKCSKGWSGIIMERLYGFITEGNDTSYAP
jgi:hypothetical protein